MSEMEIFLEALNRNETAERATYLDQVCGLGTPLRARIEVLLAHHQSEGTLDVQRPAEMLAALETGLQTNDPGAAKNEFSNPLEQIRPYLQPTSRSDSLGRLGHYEILKVLGVGGFGLVFQAFDDSLHRVVAIKVLSPRLAVTSPPRKRFLREARASAQVRHENVVQIYAVEENPIPFLVMEFIEGITVQQHLDKTGPLESAEVVRLGKQIALGLAAAHEKGLIHRDVKPANILIESGPDRRVLLTDFGLARTADAASQSQSNVIAGTPLYMAPEQASGDALDHRVDLFSLGSVLYAMIAGHSPFRAPSMLAVMKRVAEDTPRPIQQIIPEVPRGLSAIIERLLEKDPADRFQSAREVTDVLAELESKLARGEDAIVSLPKHLAKPLPRSPRWRWAAASLATLCAIAIIVSEMTGLTSLFQTRPPNPPMNPVAKKKDKSLSDEFRRDEYTTRLAAIPVTKRIREVRAELTRNNPDFNGDFEIVVEGDAVVELEFEGKNVSDISALRAFRDLRKLTISNLTVTDLTPLTGMKLTSLKLNDCGPVADLAPLQGMPLETLSLWNAFHGSDLSPLRGTQLKVLNIGGLGQKIDLGPLAGLPLEELYMNRTATADLSPLKDMPLRTLHCANNPVVDITPLGGLKLEHLNISGTKVTDLTPIHGLPLITLACDNLPATDMSPLQGMQLIHINYKNCRYSDVSVLRQMPLVDVFCDFEEKRDGPTLRAIPTLERINDKPAAEILVLSERAALEGLLAAGGKVYATDNQTAYTKATGLPMGITCGRIQISGHQFKGFPKLIFSTIGPLRPTWIDMVSTSWQAVGVLASTPISSKLKHLKLDDVDVGEGLFDDIAQIQTLETLSIAKWRSISDEFRKVKKLAGTKAIEITGEGFRKLRNLPKLKSIELHFREGSLTPTGMLSFAELPALESLRVEGARLGVDHFKELAKTENIKILDLPNSGLTDESLRHLVKMQSLESLGLQGNPITAKGLLELKVLPNLKNMRLSKGVVSVEDAKGLRSEMPKCEISLD